MNIPKIVHCNRLEPLAKQCMPTSKHHSMKKVLKLLSAPLSAALLVTTLSLKVDAAPAELESQGKIAQSSPARSSSSISVVGTIQFVNVEGGCYRLETANGRSFELVGKFPKKDGLQVKVRGKLLQDAATICQVGQPLRVESVQVIQPSREQRALEISIGGIGPAADPQAVKAVRAIIGRAVTEGVIDTYITYGYGIEGGTSSCIQLSRDQEPQQLRQLQRKLLRIRPPETTAYDVKAVTACKPLVSPQATSGN